MLVDVVESFVILCISVHVSVCMCNDAITYDLASHLHVPYLFQNKEIYRHVYM